MKGAMKYFTAFLNQLGTDLHDASMRMELPHAPTQTDIMKLLVDSYVPLVSPITTQSTVSAYNYAQIGRCLERLIEQLGVPRLFVIIDEWAQLPSAAQPCFAEFLKRAVNPVPGVSLKILAVNYQCRFTDRIGDHTIGLQRGADIPEVVDLDAYLVPAERSDVAVEFFAQVLSNHLGIELGWDLTATPKKKQASIEKLFTRRDTFVDLCRAAEGNCRDFCCRFLWKSDQTAHPW